MKVGIIGLPQTGKRTLFSLLVGPAPLAHHTDPRAPVRGVADVKDPRFDRLVGMLRPKREVRARLEVVLIPSLEERSLSQGESLAEMAEVEAFCHVVRAFEDDSVYHVWGRPDPKREVEFVHGELVLHDLVFIEKRLERIDKDLKRMKDEHAEKERALLVRLRESLEKEHPLRLMEIPHDEAAILSSYPLLTRRAVIVVLNVGDDATEQAALRESLSSALAPIGATVVEIAARAEAEIARLETEEERTSFMREMGIGDPALHLLTSRLIDSLGLLSFFTVRNDEVRQWLVRRGALAPEAAGLIHTDMQRGFIRAEVMKFDELAAVGSEEKLKTAGKCYLKGKDYAVEDGDILTVRFSV